MAVTMQKSTFIIDEGKLKLQTYNRTLIVEPDPTVERLWELGVDLANLALMYKKFANSNYDYIWLSETQRKILFFLRQGKSKKDIARLIGNKSVPYVYRIIAKIKKKLRDAQPNQEPRRPNGTSYQKVRVTVIPFSQLVTNEFDDDETEIEFGDEGRGEAEIQAEVDDKLEDSRTYKLFNDSPRNQQLMTLLAQGYSRKECAIKMNISKQEVHQKIARIRERLRNEKIQSG